MVTEILKPETIEDAVRARARPGAAYLGGGTWLNGRRPALESRDSGLAAGRGLVFYPSRAETPTVLISLERLGLSFITWKKGALEIGSSVTFQDIVDTADMPPALREAALSLSSRTLRNMATVGGELGLCPQGSVLIPLLLAMGAELRIAGSRKPVPAAEYCRGWAEQLILAIMIPEPSRPCAVASISRTSHSMKSLVVAVNARALYPAVSEPRIVVSDCRKQALRLARAEKAILGGPLPPKPRIEELVREELSPAPDMHASAEYKRYMAGVLAADLLSGLAARGETP